MTTGTRAAAPFWLAVVGLLGIVIGTYQNVTTSGIAIVAPASALLELLRGCSGRAVRQPSARRLRENLEPGRPGNYSTACCFSAALSLADVLQHDD
jgi:xanthosine utilization system XapX-like protein